MRFVLPGCASCVHIAPTGLTCEAFPDGIPLLIAQGDFDHTQPFQGDNGIQWEGTDGALVVKSVHVVSYVRDGHQVASYERRGGVSLDADWIGADDPKIPGISTLGELRSGEHSFRVRYEPSLKNEARFAPDGTIRVGPKFYDLSLPQRRSVLTHEIGHSFDDQMVRDEPWTMEPDQWADSEGVILNGPQSNATERIAESYAALNGDQWEEDLSRWPAVKKVGDYALQHGYSLHPDATAAIRWKTIAVAGYDRTVGGRVTHVDPYRRSGDPARDLGSFVADTVARPYSTQGAEGMSNLLGDISGSQREAERAKQDIMIELGSRLMSDEDFLYAGRKIGAHRNGHSTVREEEVYRALSKVADLARMTMAASEALTKMEIEHKDSTDPNVLAALDQGRRSVAELDAQIPALRGHADLLEHHRDVENSVDSLIASWATTSSDHDAIALLLQQAVANEFGLTTLAAARLSSRYVHSSSASDSEFFKSLRSDPRVMKGLQAFVRAQYDNTQEQLAAHGVTNVRLYRGMSFDDPNDPDATTPNPFRDGFSRTSVLLHPVSSFALLFDHALKFSRGATGTSNGAHGAVLAATIPASRILSTSRTGWGCLSESEITVIGGDFHDPAIIWSFANDAGNAMNEYGNTDYWFEEQAAKLLGGKAAGSPVNIDGSLLNADWTKGTWDIPADNPDEVVAWLRQRGMTVDQFMELPVYYLNVEDMPWLTDIDVADANINGFDNGKAISVIGYDRTIEGHVEHVSPYSRAGDAAVQVANSAPFWITKAVEYHRQRFNEDPRYKANGFTFDSWRAERRRKITMLTADKEIRVRVPPTTLPDIIAAGKVMNQLESGTSNGSYVPEKRRTLEDRIFGIDSSDPSSYPVYGYLQGTSEGFVDPVSQYGTAVLRLKDERVRARTTFTTDDLLNQTTGYGGLATMAPSPLTDPSDLSVNTYNGIMHNAALANLGPYIETHIHGGVSLDDIKEVVFTEGDAGLWLNGKDLGPEITAALDTAGIPWSVTQGSDPDKA